MGSHGRERPCGDGGNDWKMCLQPRGYQGGRGHWKGGEGCDRSPSEPQKNQPCRHLVFCSGLQSIERMDFGCFKPLQCVVLCFVLSRSPRRVTQGHHCPANRGSDAGPLPGSSLDVTPRPPPRAALALSPRLTPTPNTLLPGKHPLPQSHRKQGSGPPDVSP